MNYRVRGLAGSPWVAEAGFSAAPDGRSPRSAHGNRPFSTQLTPRPLEAT